MLFFKSNICGVWKSFPPWAPGTSDLVRSRSIEPGPVLDLRLVESEEEAVVIITTDQQMALLYIFTRHVNSVLALCVNLESVLPH